MGNANSDLTENILDKDATVSESVDNHEDTTQEKYPIDGDNWTLDNLEEYGPVAYIISNHTILKIIPCLNKYTEVNWYDWLKRTYFAICINLFLAGWAQLYNDLIDAPYLIILFFGVISQALNETIEKAINMSHVSLDDLQEYTVHQYRHEFIPSFASCCISDRKIEKNLEQVRNRDKACCGLMAGKRGDAIFTCSKVASDILLVVYITLFALSSLVITGTYDGTIVALGILSDYLYEIPKLYLAFLSTKLFQKKKQETADEKEKKDLEIAEEAALVATDNCTIS